MASQFDALDAALSASCLSAFGEPAGLHPRIASQYTDRLADPSRPATTIAGIYSAGPGETPIKGESKGGEMGGSTRFMTMTAEFWIDAEQMAQIPYRIAHGDIVVLTARANAAYEVVGMQPTDMGDLNLILAYDGVAPAQAPAEPQEPAP